MNKSKIFFYTFLFTFAFSLSSASFFRRKSSIQSSGSNETIHDHLTPSYVFLNLTNDDLSLKITSEDKKKYSIAIIKRFNFFVSPLNTALKISLRVENVEKSIEKKMIKPRISSSINPETKEVIIGLVESLNQFKGADETYFDSTSDNFMYQMSKRLFTEQDTFKGDNLFCTNCSHFPMTIKLLTMRTPQGTLSTLVDNQNSLVLQPQETKKLTRDEIPEGSLDQLNIDNSLPYSIKSSSTFDINEKNHLFLYQKNNSEKIHVHNFIVKK